MPAAPAESKVLVTGANGFIAIWVIRTLLGQDFHVRGTIRSSAKGAHLEEVFKAYGDKLELVVVPDMEKEGAFDEAVKGVTAIEHIASPYHYDAEDPAEIIDPAVRGTLNILKSALKEGTSLKRVVYTTSTASVVRPTTVPLVFTEADWNEAAIEEVRTMCRDAPGYIKYFASKTIAEKGKP
ncbi:hypothetical protein EW026_g7207 [Hermanssonia centrifuga]|uniref:NAD-dependent epimerase/dehydratase domain-containing protein n=1 Tax=Hermanssonia centrifuga TaxID=98765 RepID=A0A4S4K8J6_9APHY|nr:hypothetical protein EW026_g7207 [Hermanssonia centrifuga]